MKERIVMFGIYTKMTMKSRFQYKVDALLCSLGVFMRESTGIIVIYFTLLKFDQLNGWNMNEMLFLFSILFLTYGILIIFCTGLRDFSDYIQTGRFDRFMLRPRGLLFQVVTSNSDWFAAIGHGGLGLVLFIISANRVGIVWTPHLIFYYILALFGGVLIQGAVFLVFATLCFYIVKSDSLREMLYWNLRRFAGYPISIFHKYIQWLLMYIIPFAFVNYFPAQYLLRKQDMHAYPEIYIYMAPFVGIVMSTFAYLFWRFSVRYYKSTGN